MYYPLIIYCKFIFSSPGTKGNDSRRDHDHMVVGCATIEQSVGIITNVVSSNPSLVRCTRYNIM